MPPFHRVIGFEIVADYTLRVRFDDATEQLLEFSPMLAGDLFGPLRDLALFNSVRVDPEAHTLVWANGADFDPGQLHDWPEHVVAMTEMARGWQATRRD